mmetsp:Transcript_3942/g.5196  ORF Transcript_3942/g.5196 Transcript_3942/m.5196 type:complete len:104 (-) Transcript_3942:79-390(-)
MEPAYGNLSTLLLLLLATLALLPPNPLDLAPLPPEDFFFLLFMNKALDEDGESDDNHDTRSGVTAVVGRINAFVERVANVARSRNDRDSMVIGWKTRQEELML